VDETLVALSLVPVAFTKVIPVEDTVPNVPALVMERDPAWMLPEAVALVRVIFVEETVAKVPALVMARDAPWI